MSRFRQEQPTWCCCAVMVPLWHVLGACGGLLREGISFLLLRNLIISCQQTHKLSADSLRRPACNWGRLPETNRSIAAAAWATFWSIKQSLLTRALSLKVWLSRLRCDVLLVLLWGCQAWHKREDTLSTAERVLVRMARVMM